MYYIYQKKVLIEMRHDAMIYYISAQKEHITNAKNLTEAHQHLSRDPRFDIILLTHNKDILYSSKPHLKFPFQKGFFEYQNHYYYIDMIELAHLKDIHYIVIRTNSTDPQLKQTRESIYIFLIFSILFLSAVIYALSKLFLHPLRDAISKLDQFIRDTTHELNTPLSIITMSIEQLDKKTLDASQYKHINRIDVASRTISNLYNDLAFLIMYEHSKNNNSILELQPLIEERIEYFHPIADAKKISIHTDFHQINLLIDREKMIRIIDNLLSNAVKYNKPSGDIYITLNESFLSVRDTGIGIESAKIDQIFNRYTRFDDANGGFGIGLNIIQMICNEYNFHISVDSTILQGTTFTIKWDKNSQ
ncbi:MAG: HAMP domain-containing sensor histidine kinase [Sulfuricurvum sp.]|nr:HAMP domain-containing sensor histidine kinase [Sulfuricurvum sp.]